MGSEWNSVTVGDAFELVNGFAFKSKDFLDAGIPVIKIKNVKAGYFSEHEFSYVDPSFLEARKEKLAQQDDLLVSMSGNRHDGSPETWVGKVALFRKNEPYFINQRVGALRVRDSEKYDPRFMSYLLSSWRYQQMFISIATSSGGQANLSPAQILSAPVDCPDIQTQMDIAHILGALDDKIELNRQINSTLESIAQALFKSWFVDFDPVIDNALAAGNPIPEPLQGRAEKRAALLAAASAADTRSASATDNAHPTQTAPHTQPGTTAPATPVQPLPANLRALFPGSFVFDDDAGWVPEGWQERRIRDVATIVKGKSYKSSELQESRTALVTLKSFSRGGGYRLDGLKEYTGSYKPEQEVFAGDLVIAYTDVTQAADIIGKPALVISDSRYDHLVVSLDVAAVRPNEEEFKYFLYGLCQTDRFQQHTYAHSTGTTVLHLAKDAVPDFKFFYAGDELISKYAELIRANFEKIDLNIAEISNLGSLRDILLPKLVSGALQIPEARKMVEEAL